jgi:hypothetical protein
MNTPNEQLQTIKLSKNMKLYETKETYWLAELTRATKTGFSVRIRVMVDTGLKK